MANWVTGETVKIQPQQALSLPGVADSFATTPDKPSLGIVGDFDVRWYGSLNSWITHPSTNGLLIGKHDGSGSRSWDLLLLSTGRPQARFSIDGSTFAVVYQATVAVTTIVAPNDNLWIRVIRVASTGNTTFFTSFDGQNWTQLGAIVAGTIGNITTCPQPISIGCLSNGSGLTLSAGKHYYAELRSFINGPIVAAFDANKFAAGQTSKQMPTGETWTLGGSSTILVPSSANGIVSNSGISALTISTPNVAFLTTSGNTLPHLSLLGGTLNYVSTPDSVATSVTGDIDIVVELAADSWTQTSWGLVVKRDGSGTQYSWQFIISSGGFAQFHFTQDGATQITAAVSSVIPFANGVLGWLRVTRVASTGAVAYFSATDGVNWSSLGTASTTAGAMFDSTSPVEIGSTRSGVFNNFVGKIYYAEVRSTIGGPAVVKFDPQSGSNNASSFVSSTGETWTMNGFASLVGYGKVSDLASAPYLNLGGVSNAHAITPDTSNNSITGDIDLRAHAFINAAPIADTVLISKYDASSGQRSYALIVRQSGALRLLTSPNGITTFIHDSTANTTFGISQYYRATMQVNDTFGNRVVNFYTSNDAVTWTSLGATVRKSGPTLIFDSTASLMVGGMPIAPLTEFELRTSLDSLSVSNTLFTRPSTATVNDQDGMVRTAISGETRFLGARRVRNILANTQTFAGIAKQTSGIGTTPVVTDGQLAPDGTNTATRFQASAVSVNSADAAWIDLTSGTYGTAGVTKTYSRSIWIKDNGGATKNILLKQAGAGATDVVTATSTWQRLSPAPVSILGIGANFFTVGVRGSVTNNANVDIFIWNPQFEDVTGQANPNPAELVSAGVLSAPYHGATVDAVKYFETFNGNAVQQNMTIHSQDLDLMVVANVTVTGNTTVAPDNTTTADTITASSTTACRVVQGTPFLSGTVYTMSAYLKAGTANGFISADNGGGSVVAYVKANLVAGTVSTGGSGNVISSTITALPSSWYRVTLTFKADVNSTNMSIGPWSGGADTSGYPSATAGATVVGWGAQSQAGYFASTYVPTTAAALYNNVVETNIGPTIPDATLLGFINEPQKINISLQSEDFSTTWVITRATVSVDQTVSPDGNSTADKLIEDATVTSSHFAQQNISVTNALQYAWSVWAKSGTGSKRWLVLNSDFNNVAFEQAYFDLSTGTISQSAFTNTNITAYPNGWYRCSVIGTARASLSGNFQIMLANAASGAAFTYSGDAASFNYVWGNQVEQSQYPSTYIPTTTANVARQDELLTITDTGNVNEGALPGSMYFEYTVQPAMVSSARRVAVALSAALTRLEFRGLNDLANTAGLAYGNGTVVPTVSTVGNVTSAVQNVAFTYGNTGGIISVGGAAVVVNTSGSTLGSSNLTIGGSGASSLTGTVRRLRIWPVAMSNAALVAMSNGQVIPSSDTVRTSFPLTGKIYSAQVRNGNNGPIVALFSASRGSIGASNVSSRTGETWTISAPGALVGFGKGTLTGISTNATVTVLGANNISGTFETGDAVLGYTNTTSQSLYPINTALNTIIVTSANQITTSATLTGLTSGKTANVNYVTLQMG